MTRQLVITQNVTVDARADMLGGWFDPSDQAADVAEEMRRMNTESDALLLGRSTFEAFRGFWPQQHDDPTGVSEHLNQVQKFVVSSTMKQPGWSNTTVLDGDPVEEVGVLKRQPGQAITCTGSVTLCHALIEAGLVDEFRLFAFPVVQGEGRFLFPDGWYRPLERVRCQEFSRGITLTVLRAG